MSQNHSAHGCGGACAGSGGGCGACCGRGELLLCREELDILLELGQYAFLPIVQISREGEPHFLPLPADAERFPDTFSDLILSLERKQLIQIDPDLPLCNLSYGVVDTHSRCGSLALTLQGQEALDWVAP